MAEANDNNSISFIKDGDKVKASGSGGGEIHFEKELFIKVTVALSESISSLDKALANLSNYDSAVASIPKFYERMQAGGFKLLSTEVSDGVGSTIEGNVNDNKSRISDLISKAEAVMKEIGWFEDYQHALPGNAEIDTEETPTPTPTPENPYNYDGDGGGGGGGSDNSESEHPVTPEQENPETSSQDEENPSEETVTPEQEEPETSSQDEENPSEETVTPEQEEPETSSEDEENPSEETVTPEQEEPETSSQDEENPSEETVTPEQEESQTMTDEEKLAADQATYTETVVHELQDIFHNLDEEYPEEFTDAAIITRTTTGEMNSILVDLTNPESLQDALDSITNQKLDIGSMVSILAYGGTGGAMYYGEISSVLDVDGNVQLDKVQFQGQLIKAPQEESPDTSNSDGKDNTEGKTSKIEFVNKGPESIDIVSNDNSNVGNIYYPSASASETSMPQYDTPVNNIEEPVYTFESMDPVVTNPDALTTVPGFNQDYINNNSNNNGIAGNGIQTVNLTPFSKIGGTSENANLLNGGNNANNTINLLDNSKGNGLGGALIGAAGVVAGAALYNSLKKADESETDDKENKNER